MSSTTANRNDTAIPVQHGDVTVRRSTETKSSLKTTELFIYLGTVIGIIITAAIVGADNGSRVDPFGAFQALQLITFATIGYLIARGLAKSGSRENYDA